MQTTCVRGVAGTGVASSAAADSTAQCWGDCSAWGPGPTLFELDVSDQGPLREGEAEELLEFAHEHMPRMYFLMNTLREENPERFREKLEEHAPRLRQLRRMYEYSPEIGELVRKHAETRLTIRQRASRIARVQVDALQERGWERLRGTVAQAVALEIKILDARAQMLMTQRDALIEEARERLLADEDVPPGVPERLRELLADYATAETDEDRDAAETRLTKAIAQRIDREVEVLRGRAEELRADAAAEVDRRMQMLREHPEPGDGWKQRRGGKGRHGRPR